MNLQLMTVEKERHFAALLLCSYTEGKNLMEDSDPHQIIPGEIKNLTGGREKRTPKRRAFMSVLSATG